MARIAVFSSAFDVVTRVTARGSSPQRGTLRRGREPATSGLAHRPSEPILGALAGHLVGSHVDACRRVVLLALWPSAQAAVREAGTISL